MENENVGNQRLMSIAVIIATVVTIAVNGIASTGYINGVSPDVVSAKYPTVVTPAGYTFAIWSLIYLGIIAFSFYQLLPSKLARFSSTRLPYIITCVFNCAWILLWHYYLIGVCVFVIAALLVSLYFTARSLGPSVSVFDSLMSRAPFGLYFGWVTAATLVNLAVYLKSVDVQLSSVQWNILGCSMVGLAMVAAIIVRVRMRLFLYPFAIAWAATGIAVEQQGNTAVILACAIVTIVGLVLAISFVMDLNSSSYE